MWHSRKDCLVVFQPHAVYHSRGPSGRPTTARRWSTTYNCLMTNANSCESHQIDRCPILGDIRGRNWSLGGSFWLVHVSNFPAVAPCPFVSQPTSWPRWRADFLGVFLNTATIFRGRVSDRGRWFMRMISYSDSRVLPRVAWQTPRP